MPPPPPPTMSGGLQPPPTSGGTCSTPSQTIKDTLETELGLDEIITQLKVKNNVFFHNASDSLKFFKLHKKS